MPDRFFSDEPIRLDGLARGADCLGEARLEGSEAHHLLHVLRAGVGTRVTLFDGSGGEFLAEVRAVTRRDATLAVLAREEVDREAPVALTLGVAMPKGERQKALVEKLTELGAARLAPLSTERSVADLGPAALDKLRRVVVEASKQCGRNLLMEIAAPQPLTEFLRHASAATRVVAHPTGEWVGACPVQGPVAVAIGPEGGFTDGEIAAALEAGWRAVSFGRSVLRIETAAIAAAAIFTARS